MKIYFTYIFLVITFTAAAGKKQLEHQYTTDTNSYQFFEEKVSEQKKNTKIALNYAETWLSKAKKERNYKQQMMAYRAIMHLVEKKFRMIYADSLLSSAKQSKSDAIIGSAYLTIGSALYDSENHAKALDYYIVANNYIANTSDQYLTNKVKYTIAQTKYSLGFYDEAIALFTDCITYFKNENDTAYLKSLHGLGLCYSQKGRYDLCSFYNQLGIKISRQLEHDEMIPYFNNSEGINQFKIHEFQKAITLLQESFSEIEKRNDVANKTITWFYLGKCNWELNEKNKAVNFFLKAHNLMIAENLVRPDLRETYELLILYYKNNKNQKLELLYINKLLAFDKILHKNFKYVSYKLHKEYDTKSLLLAKLKIENQLSYSRKKHKVAVFTMILIIILLVVWHIRSKKRDKQNFDQIMLRMSEKKRDEIPFIATKININPDVVKSILQNLKKFESSNKYLDKDMNLPKMARILDTNTKYVSLIIAEYRNKKLPNYINDLKIDYIVDLLRTQKKFRNYTNKALAEEAGFGSTQIFTKAFINRNKISPTYFIQQLNKITQND